MKKKFLLPLIIVVSIFLLFQIFKSRSPKGEQIETKVLKGKFDITVIVTGELQAESYEKIEAPPELRSRNLRIGNIKIQDLVPEGTIVQKGDYVARLDRTEFDIKLKDLIEEVETKMSNYETKKLDTAMQLRQLRNDLIDYDFSLEEAKITLEQSKYEPPAVIRQAQINLDKAERSFDQAKKNYALKKMQAEADIRQVSLELARVKRNQIETMEVLGKFDILAPSSGMVIYHKEWNGEKRKVGSEINPWEPIIATLPDMSSMISKTYVNEIDISKLKIGQKTEVGIDAFPDNKYEGKVIHIANIGEQLLNTDAKVFEVLIKLTQTDSILRPAMTTSNKILIQSYDDVIYVPLEAVHSENISSYIYLKNGNIREVKLGPANENQIIVEQGLKENESILLSIPSSKEKIKKKIR